MKIVVLCGFLFWLVKYVFSVLTVAMFCITITLLSSQAALTVRRTSKVLKIGNR